MHSVEIKTLYKTESRFRVAAQTQQILFYDLVGWDDDLHPKPKKPDHPIFYHWTSHNARATNKIGHVLPCKLVNVESPSDVDCLIGIQIWRTRCSKPRIDMIVYDVPLHKTYIITNCTNFLKTHYCDFSFALKPDQYDLMME